MYKFSYSEKILTKEIQNSNRESLKSCNSPSLRRKGLKISSFSALLYAAHFSLRYNRSPWQISHGTNTTQH